MSGQAASVDVPMIPDDDERWREADAEHLNDLVRESPWALVEFWAPDCVFSRLMAPVRARLGKRYVDGFRMLRCMLSLDDVHVDRAWGVSALPALVLFRRGRRVARWIGSTDSCLVVNRIDALLADSIGERS